MNTIRQHLAALLLPSIVFGYAAYSNLSLVSHRRVGNEVAQIETVSLSAMLDGEVTKDFDSLYKQHLPHRDVSVGLGGNARYALFGSGRKGVVVGNDGWLFTNEEFKPVDGAAIADAVSHVSAVKARLNEKGITLLVLPLPAKADIHRDKLPEHLKSDLMASAYATFVSELDAANIPFVDAKSVFMARNNEPQVFLKSDTHWSPRGAQLAAISTRSVIETLGLKLEANQVTVSPEKSVTLWGDLTKFITLPDYAAEIGLKPESISLFRTQMTAAEDSLDVFGEEAGPPVMLVGTSYSANENWSFADYLRQSLSVDVVNVAKEGLGPGVPMMDLLAGTLLTDNKPRVVIWEFPVRYLGSDTLWQSKAKVSKGDGHV